MIIVDDFVFEFYYRANFYIWKSKTFGSIVSGIGKVIDFFGLYGGNNFFPFSKFMVWALKFKTDSIPISEK